MLVMPELFYGMLHSPSQCLTALSTCIAFLCSRNGQAVRLSYDHKATDEEEAKRIRDEGCFIITGKVGGSLAVTRAFGDVELKPYVNVLPYFTETNLTLTDSFLIIACDGVGDCCSSFKSQ
jgi:protein phosphatase PTC1